MRFCNPKWINSRTHCRASASRRPHRKHGIQRSNGEPNDHSANVPNSEPVNAGLWDRLPVSRNVVIATAIAAIAYGLGDRGALVLRNAEGIDGVNRFVEGLSGTSGAGISNLGIKLGFAYAVGAASAVNPCGFAMLPAYLGMYVSGGNQDRDRRPVLLVGRAIMVGLSVSLGFIVLFGVVGLILGSVRRPSS